MRPECSICHRPKGSAEDLAGGPIFRRPDLCFRDQSFPVSERMRLFAVGICMQWQEKGEEFAAPARALEQERRRNEEIIAPLRAYAESVAGAPIPDEHLAGIIVRSLEEAGEVGQAPAVKTLRDEFAMAALSTMAESLAATPPTPQERLAAVIAFVAERAYVIADAMLAARGVRGPVE